MKKNTDRENRARLIDQIYWENRKIYIELFEQYLSSKMGAEEVVDNFFALRWKPYNQIEEGQVKKIQITSKSEGFTELIEKIFNTCEPLDVEETDDNSAYPISENRFRKEIILLLQELKDYDFNPLKPPK